MSSHQTADSAAGHHHHHDDHAAHGSVFKRIWVPFFILFALTAIEFLIAFTMDQGVARTLIFLFLTAIKAFYIIAFFMHLKFERVSLIYAIALPFFLVIYLVVLVLIEGDYLLHLLHG